jgi:hypothetical protein
VFVEGLFEDDGVFAGRWGCVHARHFG